MDFRKGVLINNGIEKICHNHSCQNILVKVLEKKYSAKFYSVIFTIIKLVSKKKQYKIPKIKQNITYINPNLQISENAFIAPLWWKSDLEVYLRMIHMKTCLSHRASLHVERTTLVAVHVFISEHTTLTHYPAVGEC